ncbi:hypothetical protein BVX93_02160, partial [bacterium B13(2017)]
RYNMQYNQYNQLISYDEINVSGLSESFWNSLIGDNGYGNIGGLIFSSFDVIASQFHLEADMDSMVGTLNGLFGSGNWEVCTLSSRENIGYNGRNQMTEYTEESWQFGEVDVEVPILDENGEVIVDPVTGEILTRSGKQKLNVRNYTVWMNAEYDGKGRLTSYDQYSISSTNLGIDKFKSYVNRLKTLGVTIPLREAGVVMNYTFFRGGIYNRAGRQIGFHETNGMIGSYFEDGILKEINSVSIRERIASYTSYNAIGQLLSYQEKNTGPTGAESYTWQLDAAYDYRGRVVSYTQENTSSDGRVSRTRVTDQVYNRLGQVLSYHDETLHFNADGDIKYKTITDRRNTIYNAFGQALFYDEISKTLDGRNALTQSDYSTYRVPEDIEASLYWLNGEDVVFTEYGSYNNEDVIIDFIVNERSEDGTILSYIKKMYKDDGERGDLLACEIVKNTEFDDFGSPLVQKRLLVSGAEFLQMDLSLIDWENIESLAVEGKGKTTIQVPTDLHKTFLEDWGKLNAIEVADLVIYNQTGEKTEYIITQYDEEGRPSAYKEKTLDANGNLILQNAFEVKYNSEGNVDKLYKREGTEGDFIELDEIAVRDIASKLQDEYKFLSSDNLKA